MPVQRLLTASTYSRSALFGCLGAVVYGPGRRPVASRFLGPGGNPLLIEFQRCFQLKFRFNLAFDFGPKIIDGGAERFVDLDLLADDFEGHDERVGGNRVGVSAPALVSPDGDTEVIRQGIGR
jgi:hypothetical protein